MMCERCGAGPWPVARSPKDRAFVCLSCARVEDDWFQHVLAHVNRTYCEGCLGTGVVHCIPTDNEGEWSNGGAPCHECRASFDHYESKVYGEHDGSYEYRHVTTIPRRT